MANSVKKNAMKGVESTIIVAISAGISVAAVAALKQINIDVDSAQVTIAVTAILSGIIATIRNYTKHRHDPADVAPATPATTNELPTESGEDKANG